MGERDAGRIRFRAESPSCASPIISRLKESEFTQVFFQAIDPLRAARRLGPVLFQLPPNFKADADTLAAFLAKACPGDIRCAFEFRNATWLTDEVYQASGEARLALCLAESEKFEVPEVITAPFVYVRLRKADYYPEDRAEIAQRAQRLLDGRDVYVFFKHEDTPAGAIYAEQLRQKATTP